METYIPEWAREDSPTRGMAEGEMLKYYKRWALLRDVRFALAVSHWLTPEDRSLLESVRDRLQTKKATRADALIVAGVCARNRKRWADAERQTARQATAQPRPVVACGGGWHRITA